MIKLDTITRSLQIVLTAAKTANDMPVVVSYSERTATATTTTEGTQLASSNGTTPVTICAAPTSSTIVRSVEHISVKNADTALKVVTINLLDTATNYALVTVTLAVGDELTYTANAGWQVLDTNGNIKTIFSMNYPGATFTGLVNFAAGTAIVSAATVDLTAATGNIIHITGTTATSALTMNAGQWMMLIADGAWPLTYNATTNKINTNGANYTLSAGDRVLYHKDANGVVIGEIFSNSGTSIVGVNYSMVRLNTANGYGSTNTKIRRFTNTVVNQGADITYADSATLGASFTINTSGIYGVSYMECFNAGAWTGLSKDTTVPTTSWPSIPIAEQLAGSSTTVSGQGAIAAWTGYLPAGSVIRPHTDGAAVGPVQPIFTIARIG